MAAHVKESFMFEYDLRMDENLKWDDIFNEILSTPPALRDATLELLIANLDIFKSLSEVQHFLMDFKRLVATFISEAFQDHFEAKHGHFCAVEASCSDELVPSRLEECEVVQRYDARAEMFGCPKLAELAEDLARKDANGLLVQDMLGDKAIQETLEAMNSISVDESS